MTATLCLVFMPEQQAPIHFGCRLIDIQVADLTCL